jgi:hypothetical protein
LPEIGAVIRGLLLLLALVVAAGQARAQDDDPQAIYASIEPMMRREFETELAALMRDAIGHPPKRVERAREILGFITYNKAALFTYCAVEARKDRLAGNKRIGSKDNIVLTTCVETRYAGLKKFTSLYGYVRVWFPDRAAACDLKARLADRERLLAPYEFLHLERPRLYDFSIYNRCLMPDR